MSAIANSEDSSDMAYTENLQTNETKFTNDGFFTIGKRY